MADALDGVLPEATPRPRPLRAVRLSRAGALLAVGLGIAFTAPMHEQLEFVRWAAVAGLALIGFATLGEYLVLRGTPAAALIALRAAIAFVAIAALASAPSIAALALLLAAWAAITAAITVTRVLRGAVPRAAGAPSALLSAALAVALILVRDDAVAVIGFFGAYAIVRGVFLAISAFDLGNAAAPVGSTEPRNMDTALGGPTTAL